MIPEEHNRLTEDIAVHLHEQFGLSVKDMQPIDMGWLNVKWRVTSDQGFAFIKYYHPERYKLHLSPERKQAIEQTLQLQHGLSLAGVPCPQVYARNNQFLQQTPSGLYYTLQDWVNGQTVQAGTMNDSQMFDLGVATGRMHKWLRSIPPLDKPSWKPDKDAYLREWDINRENAQKADDEVVVKWLERSHAIIESLDFRIFDHSRIGWLHWDLWVDNILLSERGVAGIVDFDRMTMAYPEVDIARAVLSGALRNGHMRMEAVTAFMDGYRSQTATPTGILTRAIRLLYVIESIWWLRTEIHTSSEFRGLLTRFVEEIHWIEDNWQALPELGKF